MSMVSLLEKRVLVSRFIPKVLGTLVSMMFAIKTCLAYFLRGKFDSPLSAKPLEMVLAVVL